MQTAYELAQKGAYDTNILNHVKHMNHNAEQEKGMKESLKKEGQRIDRERSV
jgi:hypothetical protein